MNQSFLDALQRGPPLLMDGALGSELLRAGLPLGENGAAWNISFPDRVLAIHSAYVAAGAQVVFTNTFQANARTIPDSAELDRIVGAAVALTRQSGSRFVLADLGPIAVPNSKSESNDSLALRRVIERLTEIDGYMLETYSSPVALELASSLRKWSQSHELPVLLSLTFLHGENRLETFSGHEPEWFARRARDAGIDALGVNCGKEIGIADCAEVIRRYRECTDLPLFARPNAGSPVLVDGQWTYPRSAGEFASAVPELLRAGATMIGGCCGTTPAHVAAMRLAMGE